MILVLFFCAIVILVMLAVMLPLLSTIRIEITDFELSNKKHIEPNYEIIYSLVLLNKIKWLSIHLNDKKMRKMYTKMHLERIDIKKIEKDIKLSLIHIYITDLGMTGPKQSVIGMDVKVSIKRFVTSLPERYKLAEGEAILNGCVFELDDENLKTKNIYRIKY